MSKVKRAAELAGKFVSTTRRDGLAAAMSKALSFVQTRIPVDASRIKNDAPNFSPGSKLDASVVLIIGDETRRGRVDALAEGMLELGYSVRVVAEREWRLLKNSGTPAAMVLFDVTGGAASPFVGLTTELGAKGTRIVYDFDRPYFVTVPLDAVSKSETASVQERHNLRARMRFNREMLLRADAVTVSNAPLAAEAKKITPAVHVIPSRPGLNLLGLGEKLAAARPDSRDTAGETFEICCVCGDVDPSGDFSVCVMAVERFMTERPHSLLHVIGGGDVSAALAAFGDRAIFHANLSPEQRLGKIAGADVLLAPMADSPYGRMFGGSEICEAFAVKTPVIASAGHRDADLIEHGRNGLLAAADEWHEYLADMADEPARRMDMAEAARAAFNAGASYLDTAARLAYCCGVAKQESSRPKRYVPSFLEGPDRDKLRIGWIFSDYMTGSGGHRNVFRTAYELAKRGHEIDFYVLDTDLDDARLLRSIQKYFYPIKGRAFRYRGHIEKCDCLFATHWKTVDIALAHRHATRKVMYFVQDFEPYFHPMGSDYIQAENTYRRNLYAITAGPWCAHFIKNSYGGEADHLQFPIDRGVYFPRKRKKRRENVIFFAKPEMPRRCYGIGVAALEKFHRLRPDTEIVFFGSNHVDTTKLAFPVTVQGKVYSLIELAELYSNADLGIAFSPTNPSFVPYEMMACGCPVIDLDRGDNDYNYDHRRDIAFLANSLPEVMAEQMNSLLADGNELERRRRSGFDFVQTFPTLDEMGERVGALIRARLQKPS
jgi:glycosyltransferase involved in cell wall biosynthesis